MESPSSYSYSNEKSFAEFSVDGLSLKSTVPVLTTEPIKTNVKDNAQVVTDTEEDDPGVDECRRIIHEIWALAEKEEMANANATTKKSPPSPPDAESKERSEADTGDSKPAPAKKPLPPQPHNSISSASRSEVSRSKSASISKDPKEESRPEESEAKPAPSPEPAKEMTLNERRLAITAILKDTTLSGPEKQARIAALKPPPRAGRTRTLAQQSGGGEESEAMKRRKAIQAVHRDSTLTPKQKHAKIQELIQKGSG